MRLANEDELARWDELIAANPDGGNALQTLAWGDFKARWGWEPRRYLYETTSGLVAAQWLVRNVRGQGELWYCPKGPGVTTPADFAEVVKQTRSAGWAGVFARFESEVLDDDVPSKAVLTKLGLVRSNRDPGMKSTIFVDLRGGEEAVLASFGQTARRNIRKAVAAGVTVEAVEPSDHNLHIMFELMKETEARAHYGLRPEGYFWDYWSAQSRAGQAQLFFAKHDGQVLAGLFATFVGKRAWYKDGGSFAYRRELLAPYLLQWEVMRWLMAHGAESYDMIGVPNRDEVGTGHSKDGLYEFKSKFNTEITEFIGCWDLPLGNGARYKLWRKVGERVAARLANRRPEKFLY
ncbi:MAG TPA: peptidoglycan bridge formation glycyltransferase FemA/FemB family protein [Candidatus Saccharimonadia bacterium]|jgi:lipid II:glycine glycyltransferase (peptidoglycan interpeptide bridge formation enzyme)